MQSPMTPAIKSIQSPPRELQTPIVSSQARGWQNILIEEFDQPPGEEMYQSATEHMLCLSLNRRPSRLSQMIGNRCHTALFSKGDLSIAPAGALLVSQSNHNEQYLRIQIATSFLEQVAQTTLESGSHPVELLPEFRTRNPQIEQIGMMLLNELRNGEPAGQLYIESLTNVLAVHLLRSYSAIQPCVALYEGGLSDCQLLQVMDYINAYLPNHIQLSDLAALVELSQFHFSRLFKQSTGITPHQYVLQQRLERAKQLLKTTKLSVMEIAMLCGFSSHSHLGKLFRQHTGITPKNYRTG